MVSVPVLLDGSYTVDVEDRHIVILVLGKHLLVFGFLSNMTELDQLEHFVGRQRSADELAGMRRTSQEDGRFLAAHNLRFGQRLVTEVAGILPLRLVVVIAKRIMQVFRIHDQVIVLKLDKCAVAWWRIQVQLD